MSTDVISIQLINLLLLSQKKQTTSGTTRLVNREGSETVFLTIFA